MRKLFLLSATAAALMLGTGPAAAQASRTWVSGVGSDANPCSRTAPCQTFAGAILKTAAGGEISVLDPGGFGGVTITKSITINGMWGGEAGALVSGTNAIVVNAAATDVVTLRGITIEGLGTGLSGIRYLAGAALHVQHCVVQNFRTTSTSNHSGISIIPTAGSNEVTVTDTLIQNNGGAASGGGGILIKPTGAAIVRATLTRVQSLNNHIGVKVDGDLGTGAIDLTIRESDLSGNTLQGLSSFSPNGGDALVRIGISDSTIASNGTIGVQSVGQRSTVRIGGSTVMGNGNAGLQANNSGILQSYGDNYTEGNGAANVGVTPAAPS